MFEDSKGTASLSTVLYVDSLITETEAPVSSSIEIEVLLIPIDKMIVLDLEIWGTWYTHQLEYLLNLKMSETPLVNQTCQYGGCDYTSDGSEHFG